MNMQALTNYPWLLTPVFFIVATVLWFNFVGDEKQRADGRCVACHVRGD